MTNKEVATLILTSIFFALAWGLVALQGILLIVNVGSLSKITVTLFFAVILTVVCEPIWYKLRR